VQAIPSDFVLWPQSDRNSCGLITIHHLFQIFQPTTSEDWRGINPQSVHWRLFIARFICENVEPAVTPRHFITGQSSITDGEDEVQIVQPPHKKSRTTGFFTGHTFGTDVGTSSERSGTTRALRPTAEQEVQFAAAGVINAGSQLESPGSVTAKAIIGEAIERENNGKLANAGNLDKESESKWEDLMNMAQSLRYH